MAYFVIGGRKAFNRVELGSATFILIGVALTTYIFPPEDSDFTWEQMATYVGALFLVAILHTWHRIRLSAVTVGASFASALFELLLQKSDLFNYFLDVAVFCSAASCLLVPERATSASARGKIFLGHFINWIFGYFAVKSAYTLHQQLSMNAGVAIIDQTLFGAAIVLAGLAIFNVINDFPIPARRSLARALENSRARLTSCYVETGPFNFATFLSTSTSIYLLLTFGAQWEPRVLTVALVILAAL